MRPIGSPSVVTGRGGRNALSRRSSWRCPASDRAGPVRYSIVSGRFAVSNRRSVDELQRALGPRLGRHLWHHLHAGESALDDS